METNHLAEVEEKIGYVFRDKSFLITALTHASFVNEHRNAESYERLEFLGDAFLGYAVGLALFERYPNKEEGALTLERKGLVNRDILAEITDALGLTAYVLTGGGDKMKILQTKMKSDIFEAIVGAILLDSGKDCKFARDFILKNLEPYFGRILLDYKSLALEYCAKQGKKAEFSLREGSTAGKTPQFKSVLLVDGVMVSEGSGRTKKDSEKNAAKEFYLSIKE